MANSHSVLNTWEKHLAHIELINQDYLTETVSLCQSNNISAKNKCQKKLATLKEAVNNASRFHLAGSDTRQMSDARSAFLTKKLDYIIDEEKALKSLAKSPAKVTIKKVKPPQTPVVPSSSGRTSFGVANPQRRSVTSSLDTLAKPKKKFDCWSVLTCCGLFKKSNSIKAKQKVNASEVNNGYRRL